MIEFEREHLSQASVRMQSHSISEWAEVTDSLPWDETDSLPHPPTATHLMLEGGVAEYCARQSRCRIGDDKKERCHCLR